MGVVRLEAVPPGQHCPTRISWQADCWVHASDVGHAAHLEVHVGDAVADGGRGGGVALAHLLRQLHVPHLHRVPSVILRQALRSLLTLCLNCRRTSLEEGNPYPCMLP